MSVSDIKDPKQLNDISVINSIFTDYGLVVDEVVTGAQILRYKLKLPVNVKLQGKIRRASKDIEYTLQSALNDDNVVFGKEGDSVYVERKKAFEVVDFLTYRSGVPSGKGIKLLLGKSLNGDIVYTDLEKAPHILVAGTTGSGKSELLHTFIASVATIKTGCSYYFSIIDPKGSEFSYYKNKNGFDLITDMNEAVYTLKRACEIMDNRYKMLESEGLKDVSTRPDIPRYIIVIDEIADLLMQFKDAEKYIIRLAQKARACGIHLILGTQSPRRDVITGLIKANIPTKIALKCTTQTESRIILDQGGAEHLFGKGDMLFLANGAFTPIRIQAAYVSQELRDAIAKKWTDATPSEPVNAPIPEPKRKSGLARYLDKILASVPVR